MYFILLLYSFQIINKQFLIYYSIPNKVSIIKFFFLIHYMIIVKIKSINKNTV